MMCEVCRKRLETGQLNPQNSDSNSVVGGIEFVGDVTYEDGSVLPTFQCRTCGMLWVLEIEEGGEAS